MSDATRAFHVAAERPDAVLIEGVHAIKHALRFGAELEVLLTSEARAVAEMAARLAPDLASRFAEAVQVSDGQLRALLPRPPRPRSLRWPADRR